MVIFLEYSRMASEKTFQGVPVAPEKALKRERNFKSGYTGQQDEYGLDVPSKVLNDYYNPSGTYSLMNGGDNTLTPHLNSLMKAAWAKYKMDRVAAEAKNKIDRAAAEKEEKMMNNIKNRHPNLIQKLNDKFRAVSNIRDAEKAGAGSEGKAEAPVARGLAFKKSRKGKSLRKSQRRQKKTRRQRK